MSRFNVPKFKPGPWTVGKDGFNANQINSQEGAVCEVYGIPLHTKVRDVDPKWEQGMATAKLIALAPAMYEELIEAKLTTYQMEQKHMADGNRDAAKLYTERYNRIKALLSEVE